MVAFLHECSHFLTAKLCRVEVESFVFLPFGFYAKMPKLERARPLSQFLVVLMGPLSYFPAVAILTLLYRTGILSAYSYSYGCQAALTILLFNLIPLYPLDGARLLEILIARHFDEYKTRIMRIAITLLAYIGLFIICLRENQLIVLIFLTVSTFTEVLFFRKKYVQFLLYRLFDETKRPLRVVRKARIFRYFNNKLLEEGRLKDEKKVVLRLLNSQKSSSKEEKYIEERTDKR